MILHHIGRRSADILIGVVDPGLGDHMLPQIVDADIHQLTGVQCTAAEMGRRRSVGGTAAEGEEGTHIGQTAGGLDHIADARVPGVAGIQIIEVAVTGEEHLAPASLLCRTAIVADCTGKAGAFHVILGGYGGGHRTGAEGIVPAAMARAAGNQLPVFRTGSLLAEARQGVKFTEDTDDRLAGAPGADEGGGNAVHALLHRKALLLQSLDEDCSGLGLLEVELRYRPDGVADPGRIFPASPQRPL